MAKPRSPGAASVISLPSIEMVPEVVSSKPAIRRSRVDLPQPEGPTKTMNSPSLISKSAPGMMTCSPKALRTLLRVIVPMLFHRSECETAHKLTLREPAHHHDWRNRHDGSRREFGRELAFRT